MTDFSWLDEPMFEDVYPELKAHPELRAAAIGFRWLSDNIETEGKKTWPYITSIAQ